MPQPLTELPASTQAGASIFSVMLLSPLPLLGKGLQRLALKQLGKALQANSLAAASILVEALDHLNTVWLRAEIEQTLSRDVSPILCDHLWEIWAITRKPGLTAWLTQNAVPARSLSPAWLLSLARLGRLSALKCVAPTRVAQMIDLTSDVDPPVASNALHALSCLSLPESRDELIRLWAESRSSHLWQIIRAANFIPTESCKSLALYYLKVSDIDALRHAPEVLIPDLVAALTDADPAMAGVARRCLPQLQKEAAINCLSAIWQQNRSLQLREILVEGGLVATQPYQLRLLTALLNRPELAAQIPPEGIPTLLQTSAESDPLLARPARTALLNLSASETRSELCLFAIEENDSAAFEIAIQAGYRPDLPPQRALFVFLAGLWTEYNQLDFDGRLMQMLYSSSSPDLRRRIALQVQRSGQTAYLAILAGPDLHSRAVQFSDEETRLFVKLLIRHKEWSRLWSFVHTFSFAWSVRILQALQTARWQPEQDRECADLNQFFQMSAGLSVPTRDSFSKSMPLAVSKAAVKVSGRVNDVCFAPEKTLIIIGTGSRKLAVWDFQQAALKQVRRGFNHSISRVACAGSDYVLCGVRSNTDAACLIYGWQQEEAFVLPGHVGAVTALLPVNEHTLLSTGRDGAVILWNLATRQELNRQSVSDWPRAALLLPDRQQVALLHSSLTLLRLPNLLENPLPPIWTKSGSQTDRSIAQCAFFPPEGDPSFLIGQRNGQVVRYSPSRNQQKIMRQTVLWEEAPVIALEYLARHKLLISALQNGQIKFYRWPKLTLVGSVNVPEGRLTSLQISPDGSFMATGTSESSMLLWDLRMLDLPDLVDLPLAKATPDHLAAINSLLFSPAVPAPLQLPLELLKALLMRRFRFDIQVDDLPQIQPGEFDILLD